jgi:UDP-N-acetyl-D-galactosamine dehydrogenase
MMKNKKIAIIGLGYVGLPLAIEFGKKRGVIGFDIDAKRVQDLKNTQLYVSIPSRA